MKTFFRDLCNTIDKTENFFFTFYSIESPTEEEENLNEGSVIARSKSTFLGFKMLRFICNEYRESDSNACNCGVLPRWCEEGARCKLLNRMNVFLQDSATKFHKAATRLYVKTRYEVHDFYAGDIYYKNSCYIKFALKKIEQTVDEAFELLDNDNYLIETFLR